MGIFTKKKAKQESDAGDDVTDAWLMGDDDDGNVSLDSLDYLENLGSGSAAIEGALANAAPPSAPSTAAAEDPAPDNSAFDSAALDSAALDSAAFDSAAFDSAAPDTSSIPVSNPEIPAPADSAEGWHLPELSELGMDDRPDGSTPIPGSVHNFEPPDLDRRADDPPPPLALVEAQPSVEAQPPVEAQPSVEAQPATVTLSALEANADFLAVDLPEVAPPDMSAAPTVDLAEMAPSEASAGTSSKTNPSGPTGPQADTLLEILGLTSGSSWVEIRETHQELMRNHDESTETDPSRAALGRAIRREMNTAYAALRLLAVD